MNKTRIISGSIILAVRLATVMAWRHVEKFVHSNTVITSNTASTVMSLKVIAPARAIGSVLLRWNEKGTGKLGQ